MMGMGLDPRQIRLATRLGQAALALGAALTVGAFFAPTPQPPRARASASLAAGIAAAQTQVDAAIKEARAAAARSLIQPEDWTALAQSLEKVRRPEKTQPAEPIAQAQPAPSQEPPSTGPQPAQTNPILATWRYLGPITVGAQKFAVLSIRGKQALMAVGDESQAFRIVDVTPEKILVLHEGRTQYELALATPAEGAPAGAIPTQTGAAPARGGMRDLTIDSRNGDARGGGR